MLLDWGLTSPFNKFCRWLRNPLTYEEQDEVTRYFVELDHWDVDYPEVDGDVLAESGEGESLDGETVTLARPFTRPQRHRFAGNAARAAKVRFSLPTDNRANRLAVHAFLREWMKDHGHRPSHIARDLPIAVELTFCPSEAEILAKRMRSGCASMAERHAAMSETPAE
jgi:hypothetical protein